jgi:hypothetical protein
MKKLKKSLTLHRETLRHLTDPALGHIIGGTLSGPGCDSVNVCGASYTYCNEQFCASGDANHCGGSDAFSWCVCAE